MTLVTGDLHESIFLSPMLVARCLKHLVVNNFYIIIIDKSLALFQPS